MSATHAHLSLVQISRGMFLEAEECPAVALSHYESALEHLQYTIREIKSLRACKTNVEPVKTCTTDTAVVSAYHHIPV